MDIKEMSKALKENVRMMLKTLSPDQNACVMTARQLEEIVGKDDLAEVIRLFKKDGLLTERRVKTLDGYTRYLIFKQED
jgi:hypothetical protein